MDGHRINLVERAALRLLSEAAGRAEGDAEKGAAPATRRAIAEVATFPPPVPPPSALPKDHAAGLAAASRNRRHSRGAAFDPARKREFGLADWEMDRTRLTEEFRAVKRQLLEHVSQAPAAAGANMVMIASTRGGEGRTFASLNLAMSIAREPGRHVLLVDACGNANSVASMLGQSHATGWLDLIGGGTDAADAIIATDIPRLSVLPRGQPRDGSAEMVAGERMRALLDQLAGRYDDRIVLIDAPPCLDSSDPSELAGSVGQIVFVVEAARTQQDRVESALEQLRRCPTIWLLLNKSQSWAASPAV